MENLKKLGWIEGTTKKGETKYSKRINDKWVSCGIFPNLKVWILYDGAFIKNHNIEWSNKTKLVIDVGIYIKNNYPPKEFSKKTYFQQMEELGKRENERYDQEYKNKPKPYDTSKNKVDYDQEYIKLKNKVDYKNDYLFDDC